MELIEAIKEGDIEVVKKAIADGEDVNAKDEEEYTPLHFAVEEGRTMIVYLLIAAGADVNKDKDGFTPLHGGPSAHQAAGKPRGATKRLKYGNALEAATRHYAGTDNKQITEMLIKNGADVNAKSSDAGTPLDCAIKLNRTKTADILRKHGGKAKTPDITIHEAAERGNIEAIKHHLAEGAGVNAKDKNGYTPLHSAARYGHKEVVELLIAKGADVNAKDKNGETPVDLAFKAEMRDLLRKHGGKTAEELKAGRTPVDWAKKVEDWQSSETKAAKKEIIMSGILTKEIAEQILADPESVELSEFTAIKDSAAESLSKHEGYLDLGCLTKISDAAAESLAKKKEGVLYLNGLTELSDTAAESLSKHKGDLELWSIEELSDAAAESLSKHNGNLDLCGVTEISDAVAESLSKLNGDLNLSGVTEFSDATIESLSKHKGHLWLDGLTFQSLRFLGLDAAINSLSKHQGGLNLSGLTELSDAAAESLSKHQGSLHLSALKELTDQAVESLSKHQGDLGLNGLTELSDAAAESLSKHQGGLYLGGLTKLSDAAAESFSKHQGMLWLGGLSKLSDAAAESLSKHQGDLGLSGLTELSVAVAELIVEKSQGEVLELFQTEISDEVAEALSKHQHVLCLYELRQISNTAAETLSKHKGGKLMLGLTELSNKIAESLSRYQGKLNLFLIQGAYQRGFRCEQGHHFKQGEFFLSDEAAESLSKHEGNELSFGISFGAITLKMSDIAAKHLSNYQGKIDDKDPKEWVQSLNIIPKMNTQESCKECISGHKKTISCDDVFVALTTENFDAEVINRGSESVVLVDFWSNLMPRKYQEYDDDLEEFIDTEGNEVIDTLLGGYDEEDRGLSGEYAGQAKVGSVNMDDNPQLAAKYNVTEPTFIVFSSGKEVERSNDYPVLDDLQGMLDRHSDY